MKLWTYVITTDAGSAPNYDPPVTLAICKPRIRKGAQEGDVVLAFAGAKISTDPHVVVWAGVVLHKVAFVDYWRSPLFRHKRPDRTSTPDNIYEPTASGMRWVPNPVHDEREKRRDLSGEFVLVCDPMWRFGARGPTLPVEFGYRMTPMNARINHRERDLSAAQWRALRRWLDRQRGIYGNGGRGDGSGRCGR